MQEIQAEETQQSNGDMVDALLVGLDMLIKHTGTKKYKRRVFLITDGERKTKLEKYEMDKLVEVIGKHDIKLNCITLDFCNNLDDDDEDEEERKPAAEDEETAAQKANK